jgi:glycosyltransferase involved in cell wall biosynthesis
MKVDLHLHSRHSAKPTQWFLQKMGSPESFTDPRAAYRMARARGMDLVTVSDHDTLAGSLEIAHLDGVFLSEEVSAYFPEDRGKIHVLVLDIDEGHHEEIQRLRENVYDLADYLHQEDIAHSVAHPLCDTNHCLSLEHVEKMLLLFTHFEQNGARNPCQNRILTEILDSLTPEAVHRLAEKHGVTPRGRRPWIKTLTAGSDDHSGLDVARSCTLAPAADSKQAFFRELRAGRVQTEGIPATPRSLARNLYGIAYQFYKSEFRLQRYVYKDSLFRFADAALSLPEEDDRPAYVRVLDLLLRRISPFLPRWNTSHLSELLQREARAVLSTDPSLAKAVLSADSDPQEVEEKWFTFVTEVSDRVIRSFSSSLRENMFRAKLFSIFDSLGSTGSVYSLLGPYFLSYHLFTKDREFSRACRHHFLEGNKTAVSGDDPQHVALFTDSFLEAHSAVESARSQSRPPRKTDTGVTVLTCSDQDASENTVRFPSVGSFELSERPGMSIHFPSFLRMLDYCHEQGFTRLHAATPGPMGLVALAVARVLDLPICATYHAAFPQRIHELTGDTGLEEMAWKGLTWFYNRMDTVYAPTQSAADKLAQKGISREKIRLYRNSIDLRRFHPAKRNGFWKNHFQTEGDSYKLLYVGRVSRERNLELLTEAFLRVSRQRSDVRLVVVGDGPYLDRMRRELRNTRALFTDTLRGEDLSQAYASSDLFLYPSSADTLGHEVLQAQASGLPVLVGDQGGARENLIPGETGRILPGNDPDAFAESILELLERPDELAAMATRARTSLVRRCSEIRPMDGQQSAASPQGSRQEAKAAKE